MGVLGGREGGKCVGCGKGDMVGCVEREGMEYGRDGGMEGWNVPVEASMPEGTSIATISTLRLPFAQQTSEK